MSLVLATQEATDYHLLQNNHCPNGTANDHVINLDHKEEDEVSGIDSSSNQTSEEYDPQFLEDRNSDMLCNPNKYDLPEIEAAVIQQTAFRELSNIKFCYTFDRLYHNPFYFTLCTLTYIFCIFALILIFPAARNKNGSHESVIEIIVNTTNNRAVYKIFGDNIDLKPVTEEKIMFCYVVIFINLFCKFIVHISICACKLSHYIWCYKPPKKISKPIDHCYDFISCCLCLNGCGL